MQNIKNFTLASPTPDMLASFDNPECVIPSFLISEDGRDWYACQNEFADDTVKLMYDASGIIRGVVDKPVPQRGNILAVSMLWPLGMSVAEVAAEEWPESAAPDGTWAFDGKRVYQDEEEQVKRTRQLNKARYQRCRDEAASEMTMLLACAEAGRGRPGDEARIQTLRTYLADLRETDLTATEPQWPAFPATPA